MFMANKLFEFNENDPHFLPTICPHKDCKYRGKPPIQAIYGELPEV